LGQWEENDKVWQQHAMHNPKCVFVLLYKGMEFIENVKNEFNRKRSDNRGILACCCKSEPYDVGNNRDNSNSQARICKSESYDVIG